MKRMIEDGANKGIGFGLALKLPILMETRTFVPPGGPHRLHGSPKRSGRYKAGWRGEICDWNLQPK